MGLREGGKAENAACRVHGAGESEGKERLCRVEGGAGVAEERVGEGDPVGGRSGWRQHRSGWGEGRKEVAEEAGSRSGVASPGVGAEGKEAEAPHGRAADKEEGGNGRDDGRCRRARKGESGRRQAAELSVVEEGGEGVGGGCHATAHG
jgi:hypothetical protein